jgi:hypothetical protein
MKRKLPEFEDDHHYGVNGGDESCVSLVSLLDENCALRTSPLCTSSRAGVQKQRKSVSVGVGTLGRQHDNVSPLHTHSYSPHTPSSDYVNRDTGRGPGPSVGVGVDRGLGGTGGGTPCHTAISPIHAGVGRGRDYDGVYTGGMSSIARHFSPIPTHHQLKYQHQLPHQHLHTRDPPLQPWPADAAGEEEEEEEHRRPRCINARAAITPNADAGSRVEVRLSSGRRVHLPLDGRTEVCGVLLLVGSIVELASMLTPKAGLLFS